ncbi:MBOAT family protein, partial [Myxococcota bacterium]|nr:MBOAT family protein [Myxococcota bacterium]
KYFNFFIDSAITGLAALGFKAHAPTLSIILPVGISFYTFQTMSYTIDIYRRKLAPTPKLLDFALYVAFFPQLVAGPIERAAHLLPQLVNLDDRKADLSGWGLIALGVFKKAVIADNVAALVEMTYTQPQDVYAPALWLGTYAFAIQIYCDFSGYSDIAVGLGRLLGLDIVQNFKAPYAAEGPSDFWRRWHISLSSWLRDYLYIALGGNRGGWFYVRRNLMLTMLLGGLWHGAAWNFVLWGAWHGLLLIALRPRIFSDLRAWMDRRWWSRWGGLILRRFAFFHLVMISWALFRAASLKDSLIVVGKLIDFTAWDLSGWLQAVSASGEGRYLAMMAGGMAALVLLQNLWPVGSHRLVALLWRAPAPLRFVVIVALLYSAALLSPEKPPPFIYFQF